MKILAILIPFEMVIEWLTRASFRERLSDAQASYRRMLAAFFFGQSTNPSLADIVWPVTTQCIMNLVN